MGLSFLQLVSLDPRPIEGEIFSRKSGIFPRLCDNRGLHDKDIMTRTAGLFGALLLLVIVGGGVWLAVAPLTPAMKTVHVDLPDNFPR